MGGHNSGEIASAMTIAHVLERFKTTYKNIEHGGLDWDSGLTQETILLQEAILEANKEVYEAAKPASQIEVWGQLW